MLQLSTFVLPESVDAVTGQLATYAGVHHVMVGHHTTDGYVHVTAQVEAAAADRTIALLARFDVSSDDVSFIRLPVLRPQIAPRRRGEDPDVQVWAEVVGRAWGNSRLSGVDLIFMMAAGVIAGVGVLTGSSILVVGAMALSPDLLPITAAAVGLVERQWGLAVRALGALALGMATSALAACVAVVTLRVFDRVEEDLVLAKTVLGPSLTTLGAGTGLVAVAAGVAGILAYERMGGAAVGVAISVTTLPAAAYVGDAVALGRSAPVGGALVVLVTNVVLVVVAATVTLLAQRGLSHRQARSALSR